MNLPTSDPQAFLYEGQPLLIDVPLSEYTRLVHVESEAIVRREYQDAYIRDLEEEIAKLTSRDEDDVMEANDEEAETSL